MTASRRLAQCGRSLARGANGVALRIEGDQAHFAGLQTCGMVWLCPVCGPKIRQRRADEIDGALKVAVQCGMGLLFLTLTCRHDRTWKLLDLRKAQERAWARLRRSKPWRRLVDDHDLGYVQQREVTHGEANGWHPHRHLALVLNEAQGDEDVERIRGELWGAWERALTAEGLSAEEKWGLDLRAGDEALGDYMLKVRGCDQDLAMEMMRGDLKSGRGGRRTPEQIVGDLLDLGEVRDRQLWREYEAATDGWRMTTWSMGLRLRLALPDEEQTDEQLAAAEVGGVTLAVLTPECWQVVRQASPGGVRLLEAAEDGRWQRYLWALVGPDGWEIGWAAQEVTA